MTYKQRTIKDLNEAMKKLREARRCVSRNRFNDDPEVGNILDFVGKAIDELHILKYKSEGR